ncbi:MAG: hypothetical protein JWO86_696 [Myxococcaceae bacterium]|jgi:hypothetical protein|nr:hypothetical protein [Myxococcaceae bacterium]
MGAIAIGLGAVALFANGCTTRTTLIQTADGGAAPEEQADAAVAPDPAACAYPKAQGPTAPCCESFGIDACGAKLACAALEGREIAVCYLEHSIESGKPCTNDRLCSSSSCVGGVCAYDYDCPGPKATCSPDAHGKTRVCTPAERSSSTTFACTTVGAMNVYCVACEKDTDCGTTQGGCKDSACRYGPYSQCN